MMTKPFKIGQTVVIPDGRVGVFRRYGVNHSNIGFVGIGSREWSGDLASIQGADSTLEMSPIDAPVEIPQAPGEPEK